MNPSEATRLVRRMRACYPREPITEQTVMAYVHYLADLDAELAQQAADRVCRTSRFFPTIAEVREAYAELMLAAPSPMAAWMQAAGRGARHELVAEARRRVGDDWHWRTSDASSLER